MLLVYIFSTNCYGATAALLPAGVTEMRNDEEMKGFIGSMNPSRL